MRAGKGAGFNGSAVQRHLLFAHLLILLPGYYQSNTLHREALPASLPPRSPPTPTTFPSRFVTVSIGRTHRQLPTP